MQNRNHTKRHRTLLGTGAMAVLLASLISGLPATAQESPFGADARVSVTDSDAGLPAAVAVVNEAAEAEDENYELVSVGAQSTEGFSAVLQDGRHVAVNDMLMASDNEGLEEDEAISVASSEHVELIWPDVNAEEVTIYRDGVSIHEIAHPSADAAISYLDEEVREGSEYFYEVHTTSRVPEDQWGEFLTDEEIAAVQEGEVPEPTSGNIYALNVLTPMSDTVGAADAVVLAAAKALPSKTTFRYRTFIQEAWVDAPPVVCTPPSTNSFRFKGDNRGYAADSGTYRTHAAAFMNWKDKKLTFNKKVGTTTRQEKVNGTWKNTEKKTASADGIVLTSRGISSSIATFKMRKTVRIPFCNAALTAPIGVELVIKVSRSGSYVISNGLRRPVPRHEAYLRNDGKSWTPILRLRNEGFSCIAGIPVCGFETINKKGTF
ncbi:hypothetical protein J4H92_04280 [Leucobacter weissii]|uniref:Uncharacterized protein n=1 Tax=Leucobacter weissii TaxID=1983706 RepID=A0A939SB66_9MICO|nr:hypothetical protein [Leucobacter weissii]MBO1901165.1 hypothetical protein [Leucobacter weissii]